MQIHTVSFDSQGGSAIDDQVVNHGDLAEEPAPKPTKSDYTFAGWYKEKSCENPWDFATDTVTADITLYAKWVNADESDSSTLSDLSALTLSAGTLSPAFSADTLTYSVSVANSVYQITVTASVYDSHANLLINNIEVESGVESDSIELDEGENVITIKVTAQDGTTKIYTISVTRKGEDECFIATAAYGSKFSWPVALLRQFRNQYLLGNDMGRAFVAFYYRNSPPIAHYIAGSEGLRLLVRILLAPVIGLVYLVYHPLVAVSLFLLIVAMILWRRKQYYNTT